MCGQDHKSVSEWSRFKSWQVNVDSESMQFAWHVDHVLQYCEESCVDSRDADSAELNFWRLQGGYYVIFWQYNITHWPIFSLRTSVNQKSLDWGFHGYFLAKYQLGLTLLVFQNSRSARFCHLPGWWYNVII